MVFTLRFATFCCISVFGLDGCSQKPAKPVQLIDDDSSAGDDPSIFSFDKDVHANFSDAVGGSPFEVNVGAFNTCFRDSDPVTDWCILGAFRCNGNAAQTCDGNGGTTDSQVCSGVCVDGLGCAVCIPDSVTCDSAGARVCLPDGSAWATTAGCDEELGLKCDVKSGKCVGPCAETGGGRSYIGCEYWPTITSNSGLDSHFSFAVAIANTTTETASVTVRRQNKVVKKIAILPGVTATVQLPWIDELRHNVASTANFDTALPSELVVGGAYQVKSTRPISVYQFNPLQFELPDGTCKQSLPGCHSYTNDASMLLPTTSLGTHYYAASMPVWAVASAVLPVSVPGFVAITATVDSTLVHVSSRSVIRPGPMVMAQKACEGQDFVLNRGDVLQLMAGVPKNALSAEAHAPYRHFGPDFDLTGAEITASAPVSVISGHDCANVPYDQQACDHLEESMFPVPTWGNSAIAAPPQSVPGAAKADGKGDWQLVVILSGSANNELTFDPPSIAAPLTLAKAGDHVVLPLTNQNFAVKGTGPIQVAQYLAGATVVDPTSTGIGDPAMTLAVPPSQFRKNYVFLTPDTYTFNFVNVIAPADTQVSLDKKPVTTAFTPIGDSGFGVARLALTAGSHTIVADEPFGILVYGYAAYTSYIFPGGLNLNGVK